MPDDVYRAVHPTGALRNHGRPPADAPALRISERGVIGCVL